MADIKSIGGTALGLQGWVLVSETKDPETNTTTTVFRGRLDLAEAAVNAALALPHDTIQLSEEPESGLATITLTRDEDTDAGSSVKPNETAQPEVTMQGSMVQVPIYQAPYFGLGDTKPDGTANGLAVQDVRKVDYAIRERGTVAYGRDVTEGTLAAHYAEWTLIGQKTYEKPVYTMTITFHLKRSGRSRVSDLQDKAGTVVSFATAIRNLPSRLRPVQPDGFDKWLVQAPTTRYTTKGVDITVVYVGAKDWPNYYDGGTWEPPSLAYEKSDEK